MVVIVVMVVMGLGRTVIGPSVGFFLEMSGPMRHGARSAMLGECGFLATFERGSAFAAELVAAAIAVIADGTRLPRGLGFVPMQIGSMQIMPCQIVPR